MAFWNNHQHNIKRPAEEDAEEEDMRTFEEVVEDGFKQLTKTLDKLDKRIAAMESDHEKRIKGLEDDLRKKGAYIEQLLAKLLDQHVAVPLSRAVEVNKTPTANNSQKPATVPVNGQKNQVREKLAGPKPGATLP